MIFYNLCTNVVKLSLNNFYKIRFGINGEKEDLIFHG